MPSPSVTYTFSNGTTADATQVSQNFTDLINAMSDGTKDFSISALTCAGTATLNGHVNLGNASGDDLTITASLASTIAIKTTNTYNIGSATKGLQYLYYGSSAGANTTRVTGSAVTADVQLILPARSGTLGIIGDTQSKTNANTPYTALNTDGIIKCDTSSGVLTVNLPAASGNTGMELVIIKTTSDANAVTIDGNGSETINGATTTTIITQYESVKIRCDGSNWFILERRIPNTWTSWTPTGSWSSNTTYTGKKCRVGEMGYYIAHLAISGTPTNAALTINMPSGETINTGSWPVSPTAGATYLQASGGVAVDSSDSNRNHSLAAIYSSTTVVKIRAWRSFNSNQYMTADTNVLADFANNVPFTWASGDFVTVYWAVPITEFAG